MNAKRLFLAAPLLALGAVAQADNVDVIDLAERTGLTERQVRMVLGTPTSYAEYRTSYWIAEQRVMAALSDPGYYYGDAPVVYTREPAVVVEEYEYDGDEAAVAEPLDEPAGAVQLQVEDVDDDD